VQSKSNSLVHPIQRQVSGTRLIFIAPFLYGGFFLVYAYAARHRITLYPGWLILFVLIAIGPSKLLLHEFGHVVAGWLAGFRISGFCWGPLCCTRLAGGWRFQWMPDLGYFRGFVAAQPQSADGLRLRLMLFTAGGALMEVLSGCLALTLFLDSRALGIERYGMALGLWAAVTLCGPLFALSTDGPPLQALIKGGRASDGQCDRFLPGISWATVVRPADWPAEWHPASLESYYKHLDRGELAAAGEHLNEAIKTALWGMDNGLVCLEAAYFSARYEDAASLSRSWWVRTRQGYPVERFVELRAEAALLYAEGSYRESAERADEGLRLVGACAPTGWTLMNASLLSDLRQRGLTATQSAPVSKPSSMTPAPH